MPLINSCHFCVWNFGVWGNRRQEDVIRWDASDVCESMCEILEVGSFNFYMFHDGTNFGFMNGSCALGNLNLPQVTSYDYDALLTEVGDPTVKYYMAQQLSKDMFPTIQIAKPRVREKKAYGEIMLVKKYPYLIHWRRFPR